MTGGSGGIGRAVAVRLAADGALVAVHYSGKGAVNRLFHGAEGLDILVSHAGIHSATPIGQLTEEEFDRLLAVNVSAPVFMGTPSPRRRRRLSARRSPTTWAAVGSP